MLRFETQDELGQMWTSLGNDVQDLHSLRNWADRNDMPWRMSNETGNVVFRNSGLAEFTEEKGNPMKCDLISGKMVCDATQVSIPAEFHSAVPPVNLGGDSNYLPWVPAKVSAPSFSLPFLAKGQERIYHLVNRGNWQLDGMYLGEAREFATECVMYSSSLCKTCGIQEETPEGEGRFWDSFDSFLADTESEKNELDPAHSDLWVYQEGEKVRVKDLAVEKGIPSLSLAVSLANENPAAFPSMFWARKFARYSYRIGSY